MIREVATYKEKTTSNEALNVHVSFSSKFGYSIGNFGQGIVFQVVVSYLIFFATVLLKIPASIIGFAVSAGVIWDAITDPIMGHISDNTRPGRFGRRHLYILIGGLGTAIANYLIWIVNPELGTVYKVLWIVGSLLLFKTFITIFGTPYSALGAELSDDYDERSSIQSMRTVFFLSGVAFVTVVFLFVFFKSTPSFPQGQMNPAAYPKMGFAASLFIIAATIVVLFSTKKFIPHLNSRAMLGYETRQKGFRGAISGFKSTFSNRDFLCVVAAYSFTNISTAIASSLGLHVYTFTFNLATSAIAIIFGVQFFIAIVSQPLWLMIAKRIDKKRSAIISEIICLAGGVMLLLLVIFRRSISDILPLLSIASAIVGFGSGGLFSLPLSMTADTIDVEEHKNGRRAEGVYYGMLTFSYKLTQSVVIMFLGIMLELVRFDPNLKVQSDFTSDRLGYILVAGSMIGMFAGLIAFSRYRLDRGKVSLMQKEIRDRKDLQEKKG